MQEIYELQVEDIDDIKSSLILDLGERLMEKPSYRYFFKGYHEAYLYDRLLSNVIALESLLVSEYDQSNLSYKFADRGCFLLQKAKPIPDGHDIYYLNMKKLYNIRSKLVHSGNKSLWEIEKKDIELLKLSEEYARCLLVYVFDKPDMRKSENIDKAKRKCY